MNAPYRSTLRSASQLVAVDLVNSDDHDTIDAVSRRYAVAVPPEIVNAIRDGGIDGPVARQYLPSPAELDMAADETTDPIGDDAHSPTRGIIHRYPDRVLLMPTQVCAVYCRFCFRRENVGPDAGALSEREMTAAMDYIRGHSGVWEVILTGGDPLVLSPRRIQTILAELDRIPHVAVIRIHTRVPLAAPERLSDDLIRVLSSSQKPIFVTVHCNHADELTARVKVGLSKLRQAGIALFSQSVLLRGINNTMGALEGLFRALLAAGVKPYYLHHLDRAPGTSRFRVSLAEGQALMKALRGRMSGLAMPTYVLDIPGGAGKIPVGAAFVHGDNDGTVVLEDRHGAMHRLDDQGS